MEKVIRQEPQLIELFGEEYLEYKKKSTAIHSLDILFFKTKTKKNK